MSYVICHYSGSTHTVCFPDAKIPTTMQLKQPHQDGQAQLWDFAVPPGPNTLSLFKLLLPHRDELPIDFRDSAVLSEAQAALDRHNLTAVGAAAKYVAYVWEQTRKQISSLVRSLACDGWESLHKVVAFGVPAGWPAEARSRLQKAVQQAGVSFWNTEYFFVSESEAAAMGMLTDLGLRTSLQQGNINCINALSSQLRTPSVLSTAQ